MRTIVKEKDSYLENDKLLSSFFFSFPKARDDTDKEQQRAAVSAWLPSCCLSFLPSEGAMFDPPSVSPASCMCVCVPAQRGGSGWYVCHQLTVPAVSPEGGGTMSRVWHSTYPSTTKDGLTHAVTAQLAVSGGSRDTNAEAEPSLYSIKNLDWSVIWLHCSVMLDALCII